MSTVEIKIEKLNKTNKKNYFTVIFHFEKGLKAHLVQSCHVIYACEDCLLIYVIYTTVCSGQLI